MSPGRRLAPVPGDRRFSSSPLWRGGSVSRGLACFPDNGLDGFAGACLQGSACPAARTAASTSHRVMDATRTCSQPSPGTPHDFETSRIYPRFACSAALSARCSGCASRIVIQGADGRSDLPQTASSSDHARSQAECRRAKAPVTLGVRSAAQRSGRARIRCNLGLMPYGPPGC